MPSAAASSPRIVVTLARPAATPDPALAARKNALYLDAVMRHGASAVPLDASASASERAGAFASMHGLLISGGPDVDPARYGGTGNGSDAVDLARDELELAALAVADARGVPVLGICRGLQLLNVHAGGSLLQHVDAHTGSGWGLGPPVTHPLRLVPGSRLGRILNPTNVGAGVVTVNSYHHQAVRPVDLAPAFVPAAFSSSPAGDLVEAFESPSGPFRMAVQCHPERGESTPRSFERLFAFFVDACRGPLTGR